MLNLNQSAPEFKLPDQSGKEHQLSDYRGRYVLVYFYPKDDTPGCTKEACVIRDLYQDFEKNEVKVLGISSDSVESHVQFAQKYHLPFTLLANPDKTIISTYDALKENGGTSRISYLIDPSGKIVKTYPQVDPAHHGAEILQDLNTLLQSKE